MTTLLASSADHSAARGRAGRSAALFLVLCSPLWLAPGRIPVPHPTVAVAFMLLLSYGFLRREKRGLAVLGLNPSWRRVAELVGGLAGGTLVILAMAACVSVFLPFQWEWNPVFSSSAAIASFAFFLAGNSVEELIFRGYSFERLIASIGHWRAQLVTALLFAVFHIAQGWPWQVALLGTTLWSVLFGLVFLRWRSVPAAIGVHVSANWVRGLLLSDPPTARTLFAPLSPRPWSMGEQILAQSIFTVMVVAACIVVWRSVRLAPAAS